MWTLLFLLYCWCLDSGWGTFSFESRFTVCCQKYIQFRLEKGLNSVLFLWVALSGLWNKVIFIFWTWARFHVFCFFVYRQTAYGVSIKFGNKHELLIFHHYNSRMSHCFVVWILLSRCFGISQCFVFLLSEMEIKPQTSATCRWITSTKSQEKIILVDFKWNSIVFFPSKHEKKQDFWGKGLKEKNWNSQTAEVFLHLLLHWDSNIFQKD